jgi:hypothetical protein
MKAGETLVIWMALGVVIYFFYGKKNKLNNQTNSTYQTKGIIVFKYFIIPFHL